MMQGKEKDILKEARYAAQELKSLDEALKTVEGRLYAIPGARTTGDISGGIDRNFKEGLMDEHGNIKQKLSIARIRASAALMRAEEIIEAVKHPQIRAALRYYYICRKAVPEIAVILQCSEKTVKRWIYGN